MPAPDAPGVVIGPKTVEDEFDIDSWEPDEPLWMTTLPEDIDENPVRFPRRSSLR